MNSGAETAEVRVQREVYGGSGTMRGFAWDGAPGPGSRPRVLSDGHYHGATRLLLAARRLGHENHSGHDDGAIAHV